MSQAKVDRYKYEKAHRKEIMRKEKRKKILSGVLASFIAVAVVGWIGFNVYNSYAETQPRKTCEVKLDSISNYMATLTAQEQ